MTHMWIPALESSGWTLLSWALVIVGLFNVSRALYVLRRAYTMPVRPKAMWLRFASDMLLGAAALCAAVTFVASGGIRTVAGVTLAIVFLIYAILLVTLDAATNPTRANE